jgi:hypothetical protein
MVRVRARVRVRIRVRVSCVRVKIGLKRRVLPPTKWFGRGVHVI